MEHKNKKTHPYSIDQIIDLRECGTEISHVFSMYPEHKEEIEDVYSILTVFTNTKQTITPPTEVLETILEKLGSIETTAPVKSPYILVKSSYFFQWKVMTPVFVALLVVGFINYNPATKNNSDVAISQNVDEIMQVIQNDTQAENLLWDQDSLENSELASFTADDEISTALTGDLLYENTL